MEKQIIEEKIFSLVGEVLKVNKSKLTLQSKFKEDLGADSLDLQILMISLEDEFKGSISEDDAVKMVNIGDAIAYISQSQRCN